MKANAVSVATVVLAQAENRQWPAALQQLLGFDDRGSAKRKAQSVGFSAPFGTFHVFWKPCAVHLCISSYHPVTPIGKCPKNAGVKCDVDACASVLTEACHLKGMETD